MTMANQLCAETPLSASWGETHLLAFSFLRRSVQMVWCGYNCPNLKNIWIFIEYEPNFLYLILISILKLQEFWLWELFWCWQISRVYQTSGAKLLHFGVQASLVWVENLHHFHFALQSWSVSQLTNPYSTTIRLVDKDPPHFTKEKWSH